MKSKIGFLALASVLFPVLASAQGLGNISSLVTDFGNIIDKLIPILFALALLGFFYGLVLYIFGGEHNGDKAKKTMLWGIVALFVMAAVWGLVNFLGNAVGITPGTAAPTIPIPNTP